MAAELLIRQFTREISEQLFPDNSFLNFAINDDAYVNGNSVELPQSGTIPSVLVDNSTFPIPVSLRADSAVNYTLENLNTEVTHIPTVEVLTEAGGAMKRASITNQQAAALRTKAGTRCLINWGTGATAIPTTGAARTPSAPSGTGTRKKFVRADLLAAIEELMSGDVPTPVNGANLMLVVNSAFYTDLIDIDEFIRADALGRQGALITGQVGRIYGCDVIMRSSVLVTDNTDAVKADGAAAAVTDQGAALLYHPDYVRKATGAFKVYVEADKPQYAGTIMSSELRFGSRRARSDGKGIALIFEDTI
jgi:hypothetical protein